MYVYTHHHSYISSNFHCLSGLIKEKGATKKPQLLLYIKMFVTV